MWNKIKEWISAAFRWLTGFGKDKYILAWCGSLIAAFFCIALGMKACIVPAVAAGFIYAFARASGSGEFDWRSFVAVIVGGALVQVFAIL